MVIRRNRVEDRMPTTVTFGKYVKTKAKGLSDKFCTRVEKKKEVKHEAKVFLA